ncbi:MAG: dTDP-4-dehydrorhamnose reductase [Dokdonella sp.]
MKLLLLGANGQVGHELRGVLGRLGELVCATRSGSLADGRACMRVDLADADSIAAALDTARPDIVVNAAAYTAVDRAEDESELADAVNHRALAQIGAWAAAQGALVLHYSTDYVFDGQASRPYTEADATGPTSVYGRSKLAGEQALRDSGADHFIVRTAWVYASHGGNFLRTMLRLGAERDQLNVVADQIGAPTPAAWIARSTAELLRRWLALPVADRRQSLGTYHLTASGHCSWFDFASAIMQEGVKAGVLAQAPTLHAIPASSYPTRATRPAWSVLDTSKLTLVFGLALPDWREGVVEVIAQLAAARPQQE